MDKKYKIIIFSLIIVVAIISIFFLNGNRLNVSGVYQGIIPCADCEGIELKLNVEGKNYTLETKYLGRKVDVFVEKGRIQYTKNNVIKLKDKTYFKIINNNELLKLDINGKEINTNFNYKLMKE